MNNSTAAVVFESPAQVSLRKVGRSAPADTDVIVDIQYSGISTGTERLLWSGRMPPFPGLGYPLVPGYESIGTVLSASADGRFEAGQRVFVPGSTAYTDVRGLFGGSARQLTVNTERLARLPDTLGAEGTLLALAATALNIVRSADAMPELIVGHGVLGRLVARLCLAMSGQRPVVWEIDAGRREGDFDYPVIDPADDDGRRYRVVCDVSGAAGLVDQLLGVLSPGGTVILGGFYAGRVDFDFPLAFMKSACLRVAAEWKPEQLRDVIQLVEQGSLQLDGLLTHRMPAESAATAYRTAFEDSSCLKLVLDWSDIQ